MVLKSTKNIFRTACFSGKQKLALKRQLDKIFTSDFFFMNQQDSMAKDMQKIAEVKLLSVDLKLRTSEKVAIAGLRNCGVAVAEQHFF